MANTININIKNCCCTGGGTTSGGDVIDVPSEILPDPTGLDGPPNGFGPPSSISGRQCRVAILIYEWIYWWLYAVTTPVGATFVNLLSSNSVPFVAKLALAYLIKPIVVSALTSSSSHKLKALTR